MKHNIEIKQGTDFKLQVVHQDADEAPIDLTGCSAALQVRTSYTSANALVDITSIENADGSLILGGVAGTIDIWIKRAKTTELAAPLTGVYDLEITDSNGLVDRILEGKVEITPEVTK